MNVFIALKGTHFVIFICNRAAICKHQVKALMGISTEFYPDRIDINFVDVNAKSL